jgi:hypothetical protein
MEEMDCGVTKIQNLLFRGVGKKQVLRFAQDYNSRRV